MGQQRCVTCRAAGEDHRAKKEVHQTEGVCGEKEGQVARRTQEEDAAQDGKTPLGLRKQSLQR